MLIAENVHAEAFYSRIGTELRDKITEFMKSHKEIYKDNFELIDMKVSSHGIGDKHQYSCIIIYKL